MGRIVGFMPPSSLLSISPRPVALVTGGAQRIGQAIALELARHGFDVAVHCRGSRNEADATVALVRALGAQAAVFSTDLADEAACRALLPAALAHFGRVDAVVNNASLFQHDGAMDAAPAAMEAHWRVNTAAPVLLAQALAAHLADRAAAGDDARGCVVNILDQKLWNPNPDHFSYTLSKAALREATGLLARALAPRVRVVGVAPGITLPSDVMTPEQFAAAHQLTPLGHSSTADDIARAVRFLIESPAITGTTLLVDGGQHLSAQARDVVFLTAGQA